MGEQTEEKKLTKHICTGLLAHVDAGKTTLSESMLFLGGSIRKLGRVDHQDAFLDTEEMERSRGITIFSKQARFTWKNMNVTLLDTPGHVDFSAEMERTLQILDYAVLVVSGADGVQGHTMTLWRLLKCYQVPVFIFVNKMDQEGVDPEFLLADLRKNLGEGCMDFTPETRNTDSWMENLALCDEKLLEEYVEQGRVSQESLVCAIAERKVFPCYFGSALYVTGIEALLDGLQSYTRIPRYSDTFGAKVYKIARDEQGNRLTYLRVTGGSIRVRDQVTKEEEKVNQIRLYSGAKYEAVQEVHAGEVCAVTGLSKTYPGLGLGAEKVSDMPVLEPVLNYRLCLEEGTDVHKMLQNMRELEEEVPELHVLWQESLNEIHVQLMGEVQLEILKGMICDRFHERVELDEGRIVYKETIQSPVEGVGHYEPLRHYAEVHLLLEPSEPGTGLSFFTNCSEDVLDRNWQRLILTHLEEREHRGVLTGSVITDMKITLLSGKAHLKHTEGGDFRQATYRAIRHGLMKADNVLLEPYYEYRLEVPSASVGRAMSDIQNMQGEFMPPEIDGEMSVLKGTAPVSAMNGYQKDVNSYTGGKGRLFCSLKGYHPCAKAEEVIQEIGYEPERDIENPAGSVFCAHGAGYVVGWEQVEEQMHLPPAYIPQEKGQEMHIQSRAEHAVQRQREAQASRFELTEDELDAIYRPTVLRHKEQKGPVTVRAKKEESAEQWRERHAKQKPDEEYLLVDGYNIIFAWEELEHLAEVDISAARNKLMDILSNYQGYQKCTLILVFDAYKVKGNPGEVSRYHNIYVVYTKEAETADQYIEKTVHQMSRKYQVTVATSDALEQIIVFSKGANRLSALGLREDILRTEQEIREELVQRPSGSKNYLFDTLSDELREEMERIRTGKVIQKEVDTK